MSRAPAWTLAIKNKANFFWEASLIFFQEEVAAYKSGGAGVPPLPPPLRDPPSDLLDLQGGLDKGSLSLLILQRERYIGPDPVHLLTSWTSGLMSMI